MIVACGRTKNDRRAELVKLFGLLRADGIFPSAVTLGQYTRALAEGYSKQSIGTPEEDPGGGVEVAESDGRDLLMEMGQKASMDAESCLSTLDGNIAKLEAAGHRWRQKNNQDKEKESGHAHDEPSASTDAREINPDRQRKKSSSKAWFPVVLSSSLVPSKQEDSGSPSSFSLKSDSVRLVAIWSRTKSCDCKYTGSIKVISGFFSLFFYSLWLYPIGRRSASRVGRPQRRERYTRSDLLPSLRRTAYTTAGLQGNVRG